MQQVGRVFAESGQKNCGLKFQSLDEFRQPVPLRAFTGDEQPGVRMLLVNRFEGADQAVETLFFCKTAKTQKNKMFRREIPLGPDGLPFGGRGAVPFDVNGVRYGGEFFRGNTGDFCFDGGGYRVRAARQTVNSPAEQAVKEFPFGFPDQIKAVNVRQHFDMSQKDSGPDGADDADAVVGMNQINPILLQYL